MMHKILLFTFLIWTQAQAYQSKNSSHASQDGTIEVTYEELEQELSMKRKQALPEAESPLLELEGGSLALGYSFSSLHLQLPQKAKFFSQNGLDVRYIQTMKNSDWNFEAGFKNYGGASTGLTSAEGKSLSAMAKLKNPLSDGMALTLGIGSSMNWSRVYEISKRREATDWALNIKGGLMGPLTKRFSWQIEAGALSPLSSEILKGGIETSLLISSQM